VRAGVLHVLPALLEAAVYEMRCPGAVYTAAAAAADDVLGFDLPRFHHEKFRSNLPHAMPLGADNYLRALSFQLSPAVVVVLRMRLWHFQRLERMRR
jgi:hypothetical protein